MQGIIHEAQFFGPIEIFAQYLGTDSIYIEKQETYQKRSYRNRLIILGANGPMMISVPLLKGKNNQKPIKEVRVDYSNSWAKHTMQTIRSAYGSAPYFDHYFEGLCAVLDHNIPLLYDLNMASLRYTLDQLGLELQIKETTIYEKKVSGKKDLRSRYKPTQSKAKSNIPSYPQVFTDKYGFVAGMSILDLLLNEGPASILYLQKLIS